MLTLQYSGTSMYIVSVYGYADPSVLWEIYVTCSLRAVQYLPVYPLG